MTNLKVTLYTIHNATATSYMSLSMTIPLTILNKSIYEFIKDHTLYHTQIGHV